MQKGAVVRSDPRCVLHGCSREDVKGVQAFLRQKQIGDAVRDFLTGGDDPMPPQTLAAPATRGSPESTRLCQKCLKGEASHHKHDPLADNCILYRVDAPRLPPKPASCSSKGKSHWLGMRPRLPLP